ncbi:MAG: transcription termination factor Rho [Acidimicrobiales bacterium]|nr:transcription termination factor Rho [Acidimicrobiales bacterium]MCB9393049.1 transcription termination factor Rho [Acidimicrobiaceae bacterium]
MLESKDKDQLLAIAQALGIKTNARAAKATLINRILETTGGTPSGNGSATPAPAAPELPLDTTPAAAAPAATSRPVAPADATPADTAPGDETPGDEVSADTPAAPVSGSDADVVLGPDGEPLADWEVELLRAGDAPAGDGATAASADRASGDDGDGDGDGEDDDQLGADASGDGSDGGDGDGRSSRRRRRRRNKNRSGDGPQGSDRFEGGSSNEGGQRNQGGQRDRQDRGDRQDREPSDAPGQEPVTVSGYLDLRDEGYGFLRVNGYLSSREDAYIPVKLTRQYGLRKGDHVTGISRPAGRNEKNPALLEIHTVNGADPEKAKNRKRFEDLTALFPDEKLRLENPMDPANMTARIIDLISPIGKGQRGIIVSPPKAGKTTIMKTIATSIEQNHPEVKLIVLLIDERPEEVTDMRRTVKGEVIASTFDRPSDEHTHVAELAIEKAKRMVEQGDDVVIILDGITRLSRAYNLAAPASGRILSGGIDAGALYPPKKFFGAARNVEEGGSLTILATALIETNSRMDDAIFEEFKGTGNMELRLDRKLAERRIYPAIDVDASSTRHEELLFDRKQLQMVWKLRRVLSGLAADGNAAPGLELLVDRLKTFRTNDEFLNEIAKQPSM